jgi:glycosyltransferase involved in cell wall biosynthesis
MKKIVVGITSPASVILIEGQLKHFSAMGYQTYLICPPHERVTAYCVAENCIHLPVRIERDIAVLKDLQSLWQIIKHFKKIKPDVVNVGTPKMGLLGTLAAWLTGVPRRIYTCRGFRFEHVKGIKRTILVSMEKLTAALAQHIICISPSLKTMGDTLGIFNPKKSLVIHYGSSNGIHLQKFSPDSISITALQQLKDSLGLQQKFVFGYVGRIIDRKGITELFAAFEMLYSKYANVRLLVVGRNEDEQLSDATLIGRMQAHPGVSFTGPQLNVPLYLAAMNVFVLPAWWEGFGNVLVQAAAMGLPVISAHSTGCKDAVSDGYNGWLVPAKNSEALATAMENLMSNTAEQQRMGANGIAWAKNFDSQVIWQQMEKLYNNR